jgi:hypothetical protein
MATTTRTTRTTRQPSPFHDIARVTVKVHDAAVIDVADDPQTLGQVLAEYLGEGLAVRVVHRAKANTKGTSAPSASVYIAPAGYAFTAQRKAGGGVRLDADTAEMLRGLASDMGLDPNDSASIVAVARALARKAAGR